MPIVDVELVGDGDAAPELAAELARSLGQALGAPEGNVWVTLTRRPVGDYAENGPPPAPLPVFVRVLASGGDPQQRAAWASAIAEAVGAAAGRPAERVHVIFEPDAAGRVFFGGAESR
jgi:phenylpyruvate tautomerase PptA (4-oxalocrotonate tautomerase family)